MPGASDSSHVFVFISPPFFGLKSFSLRRVFVFRALSSYPWFHSGTLLVEWWLYNLMTEYQSFYGSCRLGAFTFTFVSSVSSSVALSFCPLLSSLASQRYFLESLTLVDCVFFPSLRKIKSLAKSFYLENGSLPWKRLQVHFTMFILLHMCTCMHAQHGL